MPTAEVIEAALQTRTEPQYRATRADELEQLAAQIERTANSLTYSNPDAVERLCTEAFGYRAHATRLRTAGTRYGCSL